MKIALAAPQAGDAARSHYENTGFRGLWLTADGDDASAMALIAALEAAGQHALPAGRYPVARLKAALSAARAGDAAAVAAAELAMTAAFLDYARDLSTGALEPRSVDRELHVYPERPEPEALLARIAASSAKAVLEELAPRDPRYAALVAEYARVAALSSDAWGAQVPAGGSIRLGERGRRIAAMRGRLTALGDHTPGEADIAAPDVYDIALEDSVRAFQRRHGLNDDGVVGRRTVAAMNVEPAERLGQVAVALERLRWMNRDLGPRHVLVNQADFTVKLIDNGAVLFNERVVIGKARKHRTPEFSDEMTHMIFNPVWHVPRSIASEEILPKLQEDPTYLTRKNMRLVSRAGGEAPDPELTDWTLYSSDDFPYAIKQRSGGGNALGRVKFMFPNQFSIYLHDTPSKSLFNKDARAFSHGCVRVRDPMAFARALLSFQEDDPASVVEAKLAQRGERRVNLAEPIPVHLTYLTAWVDETGVSQFRDDVYGRDRRILAALQAAGVAIGGAGG